MKFEEPKFEELKVEVPDHDCDICLVFPGGQEVIVQCRPSNADVGYNGSLDIIMPTDCYLATYQGDDLVPSKCLHTRQHERIGKQIITELPR